MYFKWNSFSYCIYVVHFALYCRIDGIVVLSIFFHVVDIGVTLAMKILFTYFFFVILVPLLTNIANGNNFIPTLANNQASLLAAHHQTTVSTSLAGGGIDFTQTASKLKSPIDVDDRDSTSSYYVPTNATNNEINLQNASNIRKLGVDQVSDENAEKTFQQNSVAQALTAFNQCDLIYNNVIGMPSQNLMMMPNNIISNMLRGDPSAAMLQSLPQFSLLNHLPSIQTTVASSTTTSASLTDTHVNPTSTISPASSTSIATKETITCKSCMLLPPNPNVPAPTTRERPMGCRTVFVGGLPENMTEEIIREVFERCGEITTLRLSKKNFCHIRFAFEASVDSAIYLSGYRVRINNKTDGPNCGRLHVSHT